MFSVRLSGSHHRWEAPLKNSHLPEIELQVINNFSQIQISEKFSPFHNYIDVYNDTDFIDVK